MNFLWKIKMKMHPKKKVFHEFSCHHFDVRACFPHLSHVKNMEKTGIKTLVSLVGFLNIAFKSFNAYKACGLEDGQ